MADVYAGAGVALASSVDTADGSVKELPRAEVAQAASLVVQNWARFRTNAQKASTAVATAPKAAAGVGPGRTGLTWGRGWAFDASVSFAAHPSRALATTEPRDAKVHLRSQSATSTAYAALTPPKIVIAPRSLLAAALGIDPGSKVALGLRAPASLGSALGRNAAVDAHRVSVPFAGVATGTAGAFGASIKLSVGGATAHGLGIAPDVTMRTIFEVVEGGAISQVLAERVLPERTLTFYTRVPSYDRHDDHWHTDRQAWAIEQAQDRHNQVLWQIGEYTLFVLLWRIEDFEAGRVDRCPECYEDPYADVYEQTFVTRCPTCYGTTFRGGFKARIVRPALWDFSEETNRVEAVGEVERANTAVQSTNDFAMRTGDYVIRSNGTRWRVQSLSTNHLRTGFGFPDRPGAAVGFNYGTVILQDESSQAYAVQLPADPEFLDPRNPRSTVSFRRFEEIRGPLGNGFPEPEQPIEDETLADVVGYDLPPIIDGNIPNQMISDEFLDGGTPWGPE